jgi:hypothetical protein
MLISGKKVKSYGSLSRANSAGKSRLRGDFQTFIGSRKKCIENGVLCE